MQKNVPDKEPHVPDDTDEPTDNERKRSYYYDDAHGYENFDPKDEPENGEDQ